MKKKYSEHHINNEINDNAVWNLSFQVFGQHFFGNSIVNTVGGDFTHIVPPCCSTIVLQIERPRPVPVCLVVNNGSNIFDCNSGKIPGPVSSKRRARQAFDPVTRAAGERLGRDKVQAVVVEVAQMRHVAGAPGQPGRGRQGLLDM